MSAPIVRVEIPGVRLVSEANAHEYWRSRQKRAKEQNRVVDLVLRTRRPPPVPCEVHIVRVAPCLLDSDNLAGSAKHIRDATARWLGIDDRDARVTWHVGQMKGRGYGVRIVVRPWSVASVGARVRCEAETTCVDLSLTRVQCEGLARALVAGHPEVTLSLEGLRLTLHTTTRSP